VSLRSGLAQILLRLLVLVLRLVSRLVSRLVTLQVALIPLELELDRRWRQARQDRQRLLRHRARSRAALLDRRRLLVPGQGLLQVRQLRSDRPLPGVP
jgi:hypothetical protein